MSSETDNVTKLGVRKMDVEKCIEFHKILCHPKPPPDNIVDAIRTEPDLPFKTGLLAFAITGIVDQSTIMPTMRGILLGVTLAVCSGKENFDELLKEAKEEMEKARAKTEATKQ